MPRFDVYGRTLRVERHGGTWVAAWMGPGGTGRPAHDVYVPPDVGEEELGAFLSDHFHESATPDRPDVVRTGRERPAPVEDLQARLQAHAREKTRLWWERYLKGEARFRGVPMADVRREVHAWYARHEPDARSMDRRVEWALELLRAEPTEDKLAGMLLLQEILLPDPDLPGEGLLPRFARLFEEGALADWNSVDWFCVKVLGPLVERDGEARARELGAWRSSEPLWQRRASVVGFVKLVPRGDLFPGMRDMVLQGCAALVKDPARFAQTGVGWVLREMSRSDPDAVRAFVREHGELMSAEARERAEARLYPPPST